jgi:CelD/BcsL family acetyltransferase involved in cellulose biosynthesis/ribosomal protein S18 acetylase RimI-like enzyme
MAAPDPTATIRRAVVDDIPAAATAFSESFRASVWARIGGRSAEAYLEHFVRDPREFMIVADHPQHGVVGACLGTMRMEEHRRGVLAGNLPRLGLAIATDIVRERGSGVELARRVGGGMFNAIRTRIRGPDPIAPIEHVAPDWPLDVPDPGYIAAYFVSPRARGLQLAARMAEAAVDVFREQAFEWVEVHTYTDNVASQTTALRAGFRLMRRQDAHLAYRRYIGDGSPGDIAVRSLEHAAEEPTLERIWSELLAKTPDGSGFHAWPWIAAHLAETDSARIAIVRFRGQPVAVFPMRMGDDRRLCFVAERRSNYGGPVYDPQHMRTVVAAFRQIVAGCRPALVDLNGMRERSPFLAAVRGIVLGQLGAAVAVNTIGCPEVDLAGGWDAVWGQRKPKHQKNWKRTEKKLARLGSVTYDELTDADAIEAVLPDAIRLYEERWRDLRVEKAFGEAESDFQRDAARALAARGHAVMSVLRLDQHVLAFSYALRANDVSSSYTLAHDDRYAPFSVGQLLLIRVLERAAKRGDPMFDFSVGDEAYKDVWANRRQEVFRILWGASASRRAAADALRAHLRSKPLLRRVKQEGVRALLPKAAGARPLAWWVQPLGEAEAGGTIRTATHDDMRASLDDRLLRIAIDRAFRGDAGLVLDDVMGPCAFVWKLDRARARSLLDGIAEPTSDVYLQPIALRESVDLAREVRRLGPGLLVSTDQILPVVVAHLEADESLNRSPV